MKKKSSLNLSLALESKLEQSVLQEVSIVPLAAWSKAGGSNGCRVFGLSIWADRQKMIRDLAPSWQVDNLLRQESEFVGFISASGPVALICRQPLASAVSHSGKLEDSNLAWSKDMGGRVFAFMKSLPACEVRMQIDEVMELGFFMGLELAQYQFEGWVRTAHKWFAYSNNKKRTTEILKAATVRAQSVNLARHLVNLPPNWLFPLSFAKSVSDYFRNSKSVTAKTLSVSDLERDGSGLILGVGQGAENSPCLLRLSYKPAGVKSGQRAIALVGKGVTFDSGGLDIKPTAGMRLMKKDMGGAAAVVGVFRWLAESKFSKPVEAYIPLAENAVSGRAMRPSDVLVSRKGLKIEIHNTDAEGRLLLADALDMAAEAMPEMIVDVATLTGAGKVGLGTDIASLFSNSDELANRLEEASTRSGDLAWRMPLFNRYAGNFSSGFADLVNATDGMAGAITAALFLDRFVRNIPWAHFDIYAWADRPTPTLSQVGGSGQGVMLLTEFLSSLS